MTGSARPAVTSASARSPNAWAATAEALGHARQALALFDEAGNRPGQARALNNVGCYHALLGDHDQALTRSKQALALQRELGDRCGEANTWDTLGYSHHQLGHHAQATSCYQRAASMFEEIGDRAGQAETLIHLADARGAAGGSGPRSRSCGRPCACWTSCTIPTRTRSATS